MKTERAASASGACESQRIERGKAFMEQKQQSEPKKPSQNNSIFFSGTHTQIQFHARKN